MSALLDLGVHRGQDVRCPGCVRFIAPGVSCPHCFCGAVPPEDHGAARELLRAGVDRFALADRVAALAVEPRAELRRRYAAQWARVRRVVEVAERLEARLLQRGFAAALEDGWAAMLPLDMGVLDDVLGPPGPWPDTPELLWRNFPDAGVRSLAALVLVHQGQPSQDVLATVRGMLDQDGLPGLEAMLALTRWKVWPWARMSSTGYERVRVLSLALLEHATLGARAAVAWVRATEEQPTGAVLHRLREGLRAAADADLRFECALCLEDAEGLREGLTSSDPETVSQARRRLTALGSRWLFAEVALTGDAQAAKDVLAELPRPTPPEALAAVLAVSARTPGGLVERLLPFAQREPLVLLPPDAQARWADWALSVLPGLPGEAALRFVDWAGTAPQEHGHALPDVEAVRAFVEGAAEALSNDALEARAKAMDGIGFRRFLLLAEPAQARLLNVWARDEDCAGPLLMALMSLPSWADRVVDGWQERVPRLWVAIWEGPGQEDVVAPLYEAVRAWSGSTGREAFIDTVWARFRSHPEERERLLAAFSPWRDSLWERQVAEEPDAVARFRAWGRVDPMGLNRQVSLLVEDTPAADLPRRLAEVWPAAEGAIARRPRTAALAVFTAACALGNALGAEELDGVLLPEARRLRAWFPRFAERVLATPVPPEESGFVSDFAEETRPRLQWMAEYEERRLAEASRREEEELMRRVSESRLRDHERQAEARRQELEQQSRAARQRLVGEMVSARQEWERRMAAMRSGEETPGLQFDPPTPTRGPDAGDDAGILARLRPQIEGKSLDAEAHFPGTPMPTVWHYVRVLKALGMNPDALRVLQAAGLEPQAWAQHAQAWGQLVTHRKDLAARMVELLMAPWE
ncbi:hypothetical protein JGU66_12505 [Myxococcaceae bacterium JPH2]|nr:hypothetical protein [Myxococcaceae bacterium JPH2]